MKYAVLFIALLFAGVATPSMAQKAKPKGQVPQKLTFNFKGQTIEIAKKDFPNDMNWDDAMSACEKLGDGWRLPCKEELEAMHGQIHLKKRGNFKDDRLYWSSSLKGINDPWSLGFGSGQSYGGDHDDYNKKYTRHVRAVRTMP